MAIDKIRSTTDALPNANSAEWGWMKFVSDVLKFNSDGSNTRSVVTTDQVQTLTNKTITGPISSDTKVLAANAAITSSATLAALTGFSWAVVAGATYVFEVNLPTTMTTNGGLSLAFKLTTATLTSIQYQTYTATAVDNTTGVSTSGTTTTDQTKIFDSKTAAYTGVVAKGSFVVNAAGTFAWQVAQNTSHSDTTTIALGAYARLVRVA